MIIMVGCSWRFCWWLADLVDLVDVADDIADIADVADGTGIATSSASPCEVPMALRSSSQTSFQSPAL